MLPHRSGKLPVISVERIEKRILFLRGHKVMLSTDLAELYEVEPRILVQAVKRSIDRFAEDFMFQLSEAEFANLKSRIVISSSVLRRADREHVARGHEEAASEEMV